jgi:hypothetical protein
MPLASCALAVLSGFARKDILVLLAKCGFLPHPYGAIPDKTASARRGITGMGALLLADYDCMDAGGRAMQEQLPRRATTP